MCFLGVLLQELDRPLQDLQLSFVFFRNLKICACRIQQHALINRHIKLTDELHFTSAVV